MELLPKNFAYRRGAEIRVVQVTNNRPTLSGLHSSVRAALPHLERTHAMRGMVKERTAKLPSDGGTISLLYAVCDP